MVRTLIVVGLLAASNHVSASPQVEQAPPSTTRLVPFTGVLTDAGGAAAAGPHTVTFSLFDEREGGTLLWTETQAVSADARGRYGAYLGSVAALPLDIFRQEQARWLQVSVNGRDLPRAMLAAVPYALRAADADTLGGKALSEFVLTNASGRPVRGDGTAIDGPAVNGTGIAHQLAKWNGSETLSSSIITETPSNRLGVGTTDPTGGGVVDSVFTIRNLDGNTALAVLGASSGRRFALNSTNIGGFTFYDGGNNVWNEGLKQKRGHVAIGVHDLLWGPTYGRLEVENTTSASLSAIAGRNELMTSTGHGVLGYARGSGAGVRGENAIGAGAGVFGINTFGTGPGVRGEAQSGPGVFGTSSTGLAGEFQGNVTVTGTLTKGGGAFQIDHPLDPENRYLRHSFVESSDMMNVYNGNVMLDPNGEAWVTLPDWFETLNRDFRYQLTAIGAPGPNLHIAAKVSGNRFKIAGGTGGAEASWQITGIRQDPWANAHRIVVEENKPATHQGFYVHPDTPGLSQDMALPSLRERLPIATRRDR